MDVNNKVWVNGIKMNVEVNDGHEVVLSANMLRYCLDFEDIKHGYLDNLTRSWMVYSNRYKVLAFKEAA